MAFFAFLCISPCFKSGFSVYLRFSLCFQFDMATYLKKYMHILTTKVYITMGYITKEAI